MPTRTCSQCPSPIHRTSSTGLCRNCYVASRRSAQRSAQNAPGAPIAPDERLKYDRERQRLQEALALAKEQYETANRIITQQRSELEVLASFSDDTTFVIEPREGSGTSEATPVIVASDWHCEELVTPAQVSGLNEFNLDISDRRITRFFQASANLLRKHLNPGVNIHTVVLALLGDFITNDIHDELVENVALRPTEAILWVEERIVAGLHFLLNHTPYDYVIVCRVGNHSRTTHKTFFSQENGHSLEHLMYVHLRRLFGSEPRLKFVIQDGYHIHLDVYGQTIRFHHGHAINYQGGVGGIFIPANKAVAQWDKARPATLDVFGHFHQLKDGGKFLCNGSLIGYNSFALQIKADYEPPRQTLFLVDKKRGRTCTWPILVERTW